MHTPTQTVLADGPYSYSLGPIIFTGLKEEGTTVILEGDTGTGIAIEHRFSIDPKTSWLEEAIKLTNTHSQPLATAFRCGFVLPVRGDTLKNFVFTAVPYRREPHGNRNQYADYTLDQILFQRRRSVLREAPTIRNTAQQMIFPRLFTEDYLSEGWAATDGKNGFLITKYN